MAHQFDEQYFSYRLFEEGYVSCHSILYFVVAKIYVYTYLNITHFLREKCKMKDRGKTIKDGKLQKRRGAIKKGVTYPLSPLS